MDDEIRIPDLVYGKEKGQNKESGNVEHLQFTNRE